MSQQIMSYTEHCLRHPFDHIECSGWHTSVKALLDSGWEITYERNEYAFITDYYIRHPYLKTGQLYRIKLDDAQRIDNQTVAAECYYECNKQYKPDKVFEDQEYTESDIPRLLKLVLDLQQKFYKPIKRKSKDTPKNNVVNLLARIKLFNTQKGDQQYGYKSN